MHSDKGLIMYKSGWMIVSIIVFLALSFVLTEASAAENNDNSPVHLLVLSAGNIGIMDDLEEPSIAGIDYRMLPFSKWYLIPAIGFVYKDGGAKYAYIGISYDYWLSDNWVLVPSYGVGLYHKDKEVDLGGELEFRTGLEISHRFDNDYRLGLTIFHLSNGKIYGRNPGTEALEVTLSLPLHD